MTNSEVRFAAAHLVARLGPNAIKMAERTATGFAEDGFAQLARNWGRIAAAIRPEGENHKVSAA